MAQRRDLTLTGILKHLKPAQLWALLGATAAMLVASVAVGAWLTARIGSIGRLDPSTADCDLFEVGQRDEERSLAVALNTERASDVVKCYREGLYYAPDFEYRFQGRLKVSRTGWVHSLVGLEILALSPPKTNQELASTITTSCLHRLLSLAHFRELDEEGTRYFLVRFDDIGLDGRVSVHVERTEAPPKDDWE